MNNLAPIILFTYNRISTLKKCVTSLNKNKLSEYSKIYIFSDGPKNIADKSDINQVRNYIKKIKGFKNIKIIYRKQNFGLAKNITSGTSNILKKEKKAIIIEDDIVCSKNFLHFMNSALSCYEKNKKIFHISGWNYNVKINLKEDAYLTRGMNCWGWATWKDRWEYYEKNPKRIIKTWKNKKIKAFNFENSYNFFSQIIRNNNKTLNSWAIFWYASIFNKKKLCLNPKNSLTQNIGIGKKSTNTISIEKIFNTKIKKNNNEEFKFPKKIIENYDIFLLIKKEFNNYNRISILKRIIPFIK